MRSLLVLFIMCTSIVQAQILDNRDCTAFTDEPFFNTVFIQSNNIKTIIGTLSTKRKLSPIKSKGLIEGYGFSENGCLDQQYKTTIKSGGLIDTTVIRYIYNDAGMIKTKRRNDKHGFFSYNYTFDSTGHINSEEYCRDENKGPTKSEFQLGKQYVIVSEKYENTWLSDKELQRKYFNNYGRPYQAKYFRWNEDDYLIEEETVLLLNSKKNITKFLYNEKGQVVTKIQSSNVTGNSTLEYKYAYDEVGNLLSVDEYRNGSHVTNKQIIYDGKTMLMSAVIIMDVDTEYMNIVRYEYLFYD